MISESGRPLICDFGISRMLNFSITLKTKTTNNARGTQRFMSPELLVGEGKNTKASDIWALGMTFYVCFTHYISDHSSYIFFSNS